MNTSTFSEWLQDQLEARGWTQAKLARRAKLKRGTISNILNRVRRPGPDVLSALARALDLPEETLFRKAGLLPPTKEELDELEEEWQHLFDMAQTDEEREELIERARFELTRIRERRGDYDDQA